MAQNLVCLWSGQEHGEFRALIEMGRQIGSGGVVKGFGMRYGGSKLGRWAVALGVARVRVAVSMGARGRAQGVPVVQKGEADLGGIVAFWYNLGETMEYWPPIGDDHA